MLLTIGIVILALVPVLYFLYTYVYLYNIKKVDKKYSWYGLGFVTLFFWLIAGGLLASKLGYW